MILEVNQRVLAEREQLLFLRSKLGTPAGLTPVERMWLEQLADRYDTSSDKLDELVRRVDIVPPSMAIAQGGVESGWGTSLAARTGNALFGQIQVGAGTAYVRGSRAPACRSPSAMSARRPTPMSPTSTPIRPSRFPRRARRLARARRALDGYRLIGTLLRYSELGQQYVGFVRVMRDDKLTDFDKARLSSY